MEESFSFSFLPSYLLSLLPLVCFLLDVVLDILAVLSFYRDGDYVFMVLLMLLLISSSALQQIFSWLWYDEPCETRIETYAQRCRLLGVIHVFQLGIFLRFAGVLESSFRSLSIGANQHDLSMLRVFEAFSENAPQIVLVLVYVIQTTDLHSIPVLKLVVSLSALALTVVSYHRNMRAFTSTKSRMSWPSSALYFLWNLFLIGPRVVSVSLFASVLPCYVAAHFLSWWMLLVFWAWMQKTDFMDSTAGEWLYRGTVALVWYFSWFNVKRGRTKLKALFYHIAMGTDMMLLLGLWWWRRSVESACLGPLPVPPHMLVLPLILSYVTGLVLKVVYYWKWHPNKSETQIDVRYERPMTDPEGTSRCSALSCRLETDSAKTNQNEQRPQESLTGVHKRMTNMAAHFYC